MKLETLKIANELKEKIEFRENMLDVLKNKKNPTLTYYHEGYNFSDSGYSNAKKYVLDEEVVKSLITIISYQKEKLEKELQEL